MALENTLLDIHHPETGRRTRYVQTENGALIVNDQDRAAILEDNARWRAVFDKWNASKQNLGSTNTMIRVASIPMADWLMLDRLGITRHQASLRAFLNRPDAQKFRTDDGRKL
jgi:hypothetical protein